MKTITDKNDCYEVVDGQNHYLVSYDYGCYMLKDDQTRLNLRESWKSYMDDLDAKVVYVHPAWSKALGTRGYRIKENFKKYLDVTYDALREQIQLCVGTPLLFNRNPSCYEPAVFAIEDGHGVIHPVLQRLYWFSRNPPSAIDLGTYRSNHYELNWRNHDMVDVVSRRGNEMLVFGWSTANICVTPIVKPVLISSPSKKKSEKLSELHDFER